MGPEANILEPSADQCRRLWLEQPILSLWDMRVIKATDYKGWKVNFILLEIIYGIEKKFVCNNDCNDES